MWRACAPVLIASGTSRFALRRTTGKRASWGHLSWPRPTRFAKHEGVSRVATADRFLTTAKVWADGGRSSIDLSSDREDHDNLLSMVERLP